MAHADERPPVWVGHILMKTSRLTESWDFLTKIGLRPIELHGNVAVLELRGGTHLVLTRSDHVLPGPAPFDLMVDDLEKTHRLFTDVGLGPSPIQTGPIHRSFTVEDPSGQRITFNSSHASGKPV
ncbi:MAG TPA: VOC family protein [Myxococcota bacterium]|nr:VOC family protein [Myxococcota bacterium]